MMETKELTNDLLKSKMSDAMVWRGLCKNADTCRSSGVYQMDNSCTGQPPGASMWGILEVSVTSHYVSQRYMPVTAVATVYVRTFVYSDAVPPDWTLL